MKEFLFSRSHKKHYSSAVVRMGKNNLGFSLVELIIVIAIMAILVAVAIPVLGIFIEKANVANDKQAVTDVMYAIDLGGQSLSYDIETPAIEAQGMSVPVGMVLLTNEGIIILGSTPDNENALNALLEDALGTGYTNSYVLKTAGWTPTYASFYANAGNLLQDVQETGGDMIDFMDDLGKLHINVFGSKQGLSTNGDGSLTLKLLTSSTTKQIMSQDYESSDELVAKLAQVLKENTDREAFINEWVNGINTEDQEGFAVGAKGSSGLSTTREFYSAVRRAYNQCLAEYVSSKGTDYMVGNTTHANVSEHTNHIKLYGEGGMEMIGKMFNKDLSEYGSPEGGDVTFPQTVCDATFTQHQEGGRYGAFVDCACCQALCNEYAGSKQAEADAAAFYDTMVAGASWSNPDPNKESHEGIIEWANTQVDVFADLYSRLDNNVAGKESAVLITVYQNEDGTLYAECNTPGVLDE